MTHLIRRLPAATLVLVLVGMLASSCGFKRKKYENPITHDTEQPDKALYDKAIKDIEKGRYEVARLTLNTLMNTYDTSEFMAKSKLAIADSWMRESGSHGMAQAEAEYKDFILFYPTMEESAEAQEKICGIHMKQMEKPDRDPTHSLRAEDECRNLLLQFPNSKFAPRVEQTLRQIQEVIAEAEFRVGEFYYKKGSFPSAANRLETMVNHYPLYSGADASLFMVGDSYGKLGPRFREQSATAFQRIVRDYPLSPFVDEAKKQLTAMEKEIPEADPVAVARMKYEQENATKQGKISAAMGMFRKSPDTFMAAKSGTPANTPLRPSIPVSVPTPEALAAAAAGAQADVTVSTVGGANSALDTQPEARQNAPKPGGAQGAKGEEAAAAATSQPAPAAGKNGKNEKNDKKKKEKKPSSK